MKLNWAERWAVNNPLRPVQQRREIRWMRKRVQLKPGAIVAEVGCGRGVGACILKEEFQPQLLQAMDLDVEMIQRGRKHRSPRQREGISFFLGDVIRLPYRDATLDAIFGFGILHHIPDWRELWWRSPGFSKSMESTSWKNYILRFTRTSLPNISSCTREGTGFTAKT